MAKKLQAKKVESKDKKKATKSDIAKVNFIQSLKEDFGDLLIDDGFCVTIAELSKTKKGSWIDFHRVMENIPKSSNFDGVSLECILDKMGFILIDQDGESPFPPEIYERVTYFEVKYDEIAPGDEPEPQADEDSAAMDNHELTRRVLSIEAQLTSIQNNLNSLYEEED